MSNKTYSIISTEWNSHRDALRKIRDQVFIHEQNVSVEDEWDDKDEAATHFLVFSEELAVGCARVFIEEGDFHIGRVAVLAEYRQLGVGRKLMQHVVSWCKQQNPDYGVYLHAQTTRIGFYQHLGFVGQGDIFMDAGIEHIEMWYQH
jgi:predicted GNAT family N-acyltransferase